jgi:hypothetical protein
LRPFTEASNTPDGTLPPSTFGTTRVLIFKVSAAATRAASTGSGGRVLGVAGLLLITVAGTHVAAELSGLPMRKN